MANNKNLIKNEDLTPSERRENAKKAGTASGKKRRKRRELKEELLLLLETGDMQAKLSLALIKQALKGNVKAFEVIRDTIGEKPLDKKEITGRDGAPLTAQKEYILPADIKDFEEHYKQAMGG